MEGCVGQGWPVEERVKAYRIRAKDDEDCLLEHCGFLGKFVTWDTWVVDCEDRKLYIVYSEVLSIGC